MTLRIYTILGGFAGADGYLDSAGLYGLNSILHTAFPGCIIQTYEWGDYQSAARDMLRHQNDVIVAIGYSGGGSRITFLANERPRPRIDLAIFYDPSPKWQMLPIGANVERAVTYENHLPLFFGLGGGILTAKQGGPRIKRVIINEPHMLVQTNGSLHTQTVQEIRKLTRAS